MRIFDYTENIAIAVHNLRKKKIRSLLTMLGVIIGVAAIVIIMALGDSNKEQIGLEMQRLGTDLIFLDVKNQSQPLKQIDLSSIQSISRFAQRLSPVQDLSLKLEIGNISQDFPVVAANENYGEIKRMTMIYGHFFNRFENETSSRVCVIENTEFFKKIFNSRYPVGQTLFLNHVYFTIVGVVAPKTDSIYEQGRIYIPIKTSQNYFPTQAIYNAVAQIDNPKKIRPAMGELDAITQFFYADKVKISGLLSTIEATKKIIAKLTMVIGGIAAISLVVGGIGIMNIMLVSVMERTREIGILKAIGAKELYILIQFLTEAILLTFLGGVLGIIIGMIFSFFTLTALKMPVVIPFIPAIIGLIFSVIIGICSGLYPSLRAARMDPVIAMRSL